MRGKLGPSVWPPLWVPGSDTPPTGWKSKTLKAWICSCCITLYFHFIDPFIHVVLNWRLGNPHLCVRTYPRHSPRCPFAVHDITFCMFLLRGRWPWCGTARGEQLHEAGRLTTALVSAQLGQLTNWYTERTWHQSNSCHVRKRSSGWLCICVQGTCYRQTPW